MTLKTAITSSATPEPLGAFSWAIKVDGPTQLLFVSGLTSRSPDGSVVGEGDITLQTETVLRSLRAIVESAGGKLADIVKVTVFIRDMTHFRQIHDVRRRFFSPPYPASTMVEVNRLVDPRSLIEIDAIAVIG